LAIFSNAAQTSIWVGHSWSKLYAFPNQFPISHVVNQFPIIWMCWWRNLKITKIKRKEMALHNWIF
jgi:hypothetical protein